jgi:Protein of unknown function (DUF1353)
MCAERDEPARVVLRQTDATHFQLMEGFRYTGPGGSWTVTPDDLSDTDLASIPQFLSWFVSPYGTHTLAALLHDHLCRNGARLQPPVPRHHADKVFLDALGGLDVPYLRSHIMWAAVTFATRWHASWVARLAVGVWAVAAMVGVVTLAWGAVTFEPGLLLLAGLAPVPAALLWGRQVHAGLVGGYTLWLVALPALLNLVAFGVYWLAEHAVRRLRLLVARPHRATQTAKPPPYSAR